MIINYKDSRCVGDVVEIEEEEKLIMVILRRKASDGRWVKTPKKQSTKGKDNLFMDYHVKP